MNDASEADENAPAMKHGTAFWWEIHEFSDGAHRQGPCGTCASEDVARSCIEAALHAVTDPETYAWGQVSRIPLNFGTSARSWPRIPIAWAALGPGGRVAWLRSRGWPSAMEEREYEMPVAFNSKSISSLLSYFGSEVRRYRHAAGLTQEELGEQMHYTAAMIGHIENAKRMPSRSFTQQADQLLHADGALVKLWPLLTQSAHPDWFQQIVELEREASSIHEFESVAVPGLLQTEAYARAILTSARPMDSELQIEQLVAARTDRQRILSGHEPPQMVVTLDEGVLRRRIGGDKIMSEQLGYLLEMSSMPRVHLQVIPFSTREHPGGMTPFRIMGFQEGPDVLYGETFINGQMTNSADQVRQHKLAFNLFQAKALPKDDSHALIYSIQKDINNGYD
ncbi:helix-turn-helix domain-containing protein [Allosalinactinospora lopnorensis]|uniref:helix-turn-helix domain-containing protein n=1 Tax=Allosalinactinospora lopnorensis TaxID=1352348 RepID=UPI0009E456AD|nr:helix-turn-helix transcriptional regulator [Allosalinactinospora lopnorensis]